MSQFQTILVVDDEPALLDAVTYNLRQAGFETVAALDGRDALRVADEARPDLVILDLMLPGLDGFTVCRVLRERDPGLPIIMLTARDEEVDRVLGLEVGADDYVTKPFSPRELVARVRAVLRRAGGRARGSAQGQKPESGLVDLGAGVLLDRPGREVTRRGEPVQLTPAEFNLLEALATHAGQALSRRQLVELVWGEAASGDERSIDVHVRHLREKLEDDPTRPSLILTVRGYGYKLRAGGGAG